jgi:hypothetical protein
MPIGKEFPSGPPHCLTEVKPPFKTAPSATRSGGAGSIKLRAKTPIHRIDGVPKGCHNCE